MVSNGADKTLLTLSQVEKWRAERENLELELQRLQQDLTAVMRKLAAAAEFMGSDEEENPKPSAQQEAEGGGETMADAILRVVAGRSDGALPSEIKGALVASGSPLGNKIKANPTYFYSVLNKLLAREKVERRRNGAYRLPAKSNSPQGETGAVAAPVSVSTH